jgi:hypothetical protein
MRLSLNRLFRLSLLFLLFLLAACTQAKGELSTGTPTETLPALVSTVSRGATPTQLTTPTREPTLTVSPTPEPTTTQTPVSTNTPEVTPTSVVHWMEGLEVQEFDQPQVRWSPDDIHILITLADRAWILTTP